MKKKVLALSMHKFGSNVIEKCLVHAEIKQRDELINEILTAKLANDETNAPYQSNVQNFTLTDQIKDKYGNYVI